MRKGFTLAEVLITLGIIGVVAALTMPSLIAKYKEKVTFTKLKKLYSIMSQAYFQAREEHGNVSAWCEGLRLESSVSGECQIKTHDIMIPYLKVLKDCKLDGGCFSNEAIKNPDGSIFGSDSGQSYGIPNYRWSTLVLADGTLLLFQYTSSERIGVYTDIDGPDRGPNQYGRDDGKTKCK
ncbi:MAG: type II secretion system GspH family protein [Heliobacteriaceae bacterium]|jgi:prepilin-type N-terminal cleavage/methylation domain-containing protein|nr:type II secretion system GspH family protein [Heliobacteriaceae bacterium]